MYRIAAALFVIVFAAACDSTSGRAMEEGPCEPGDRNCYEVALRIEGALSYSLIAFSGGEQLRCDLTKEALAEPETAVGRWYSCNWIPVERTIIGEPCEPKSTGCHAVTGFDVSGSTYRLRAGNLRCDVNFDTYQLVPAGTPWRCEWRDPSRQLAILSHR